MPTAIKEKTDKKFRIKVGGIEPIIVPSSQVESVCRELADEHNELVFVYQADGSQIFGVLGSTDCVGIFDPQDRKFHAQLATYTGDALVEYLDGGKKQEKTHIEIGYAENSDKELFVFIEFKDECETKVYHISAETARWAADNLMRQADKVEGDA